jgi:hypothetical protein
MFNLNMAPPKWAKDTLDLADSPTWLFDDSDSGTNLKNHLSYLTLVLLGTVGPHLLYCWVSARNGWFVPGPLRYPGFEIVAFMCAAMGLLDNGSAVLTSQEGGFDAGWGWRFLALMEVLLALIFVYKFYSVGKEYFASHEWRDLLNAPQLKFWVALDTDNDGLLSKEEVVAGAKELGMTPEQAAELFDEVKV